MARAKKTRTSRRQKARRKHRPSMLLSRHNYVLILIGVEIMLAAVSINFVAFAAYLHADAFTGLIFALFVITVAAAEVGLALGIVLRIFREHRTSYVDEVSSLRW
jgi:NADH:ubiquinone oxidoreductase subunit K